MSRFREDLAVQGLTDWKHQGQASKLIFLDSALVSINVLFPSVFFFLSSVDFTISTIY